MHPVNIHNMFRNIDHLVIYGETVEGLDRLCRMINLNPSPLKNLTRLELYFDWMDIGDDWQSYEPDISSLMAGSVSKLTRLLVYLPECEPEVLVRCCGGIRFPELNSLTLNHMPYFELPPRQEVMFPNCTEVKLTTFWYAKNPMLTDGIRNEENSYILWRQIKDLYWDNKGSGNAFGYYMFVQSVHLGMGLNRLHIVDLSSNDIIELLNEKVCCANAMVFELSVEQFCAPVCPVMKWRMIDQKKPLDKPLPELGKPQKCPYIAFVVHQSTKSHPDAAHWNCLDLILNLRQV